MDKVWRPIVALWGIAETLGVASFLFPLLVQGYIWDRLLQVGVVASASIALLAIAFGASLRARVLNGFLVAAAGTGFLAQALLLWTIRVMAACADYGSGPCSVGAFFSWTAGLIVQIVAVLVAGVGVGAPWASLNAHASRSTHPGRP